MLKLKAQANAPSTVVGSSDGFASSYHGGGAQVLMFDGSVRFLGRDVEPAVVRAMLSPRAGDEVDDW